MFSFNYLGLGEVLHITPKTYEDDRGFFCETFREDDFSSLPKFVQSNMSFSKYGVLRGLHYQKNPKRVAKLVSCVQGFIKDIVVDIRPQSNTYKQWACEYLKADGSMIYVPEGFAHGFITLSDTATVSYKVSDYYSPKHDSSVRWNDPELNIDWDLPKKLIELSDKDRNAPLLKDAPII